MNIASLKTLDLVFAAGETKFCRCNHNLIVIPGSRQNVFSCVPCHEKLLVALIVVKAFEEVLVDPKVYQEELGVKPVAKSAVIGNVVAHSAGLGFLARHQSWTEMHLRGSQTVGVESDGSAVLELALNGRTNGREVKGQRMSSVVCCTGLHLSL